MRTKVVVTGFGIVSPMGNDVRTFWENVCAGKSCVKTIDRWDPSSLPTRIAGLAPALEMRDMSSKDLRRRDTYTIYALYAAIDAWKQSGLDIAKEVPERCGTTVGSGRGGIQTLEESHEKFMSGG